MDNVLSATHFTFDGQTNFYKGKVRDVYTIENKTLIMIASDRISAFDVVLPRPIPYKGQVLNQIAAKFLALTADIIPNWVLAVPDPVVTAGKMCEPFKVEMVIRGYLSGHAWREYRAGRRVLCGINMPDGLKENDPFPKPIITPTTKAAVGHDEDISEDAILKSGIVSEADYNNLKKYTYALFKRGTEFAAGKGLILVDTKYEFGKDENGNIFLIDEIHTPDSSRYFYADGYAERQALGTEQKQLSKEFVRQWLIEHGFQGQPGQRVPLMTDDFVNAVSDRYIELYESIVGEPFVKADVSAVTERVEKNIRHYLTGKK
jgi:phosphoribosylaminoimidazole-succinocarboxamide synthase